VTSEPNTEDFNAAVSELEKAATPAVHALIGALLRNTDQMSASSKEVLGIADAHVDRLAGATARVVATGAQLMVTAARGIGGAPGETPPAPDPPPSKRSRRPRSES
jgi:hypothetical protein